MSDTTNEQLRAALENVLRYAVTDHDYKFPGCPGCNAVIEAERLLGKETGEPNPTWMRRMISMVRA